MNLGHTVRTPCDTDAARRGAARVQSDRAESRRIAERYPTADEAVVQSEEVLLLLRRPGSVVSSGRDPEFAAIGHATIGPAGTIRWKGFPGDLAGTTGDLQATLEEMIPAIETSDPDSRRRQAGRT